MNTSTDSAFAIDHDRPTAVFPIWMFQVSGLNSFTLRLMALLRKCYRCKILVVTARPVPAPFDQDVAALADRVWICEPRESFIDLGKRVLRKTTPDVFVPSGPFDLEMAKVLGPATRIWFWSHGLGSHWERMIALATLFEAEICLVNPVQFKRMGRRFPGYARFHPARFWLDGMTPPCPATKPPLRLLHCGRLDDATKRVRLGLTLARQLRARGVAYQLDFVGDGPFRETLSQMIQEQRLDDQVRILAVQNPQALSELMDSYHAILSFSRQESFGLAVLEGMARGLVPLCLPTQDDGFAWLGDTPWPQAVVPNINAMADQLVKLDHELLGTNAFEHLRREIHTWVGTGHAPKQACSFFDLLWSVNRFATNPNWWRHPLAWAGLKILCQKASKKAQAYERGL